MIYFSLVLQIKLMGTREKAVDVDFSTISMEEEVESQLKEAAVISMGTEVSEADMLNIVALCDQVQCQISAKEHYVPRQCSQPYRIG